MDGYRLRSGLGLEKHENRQKLTKDLDVHSTHEIEYHERT